MCQCMFSTWFHFRATYLLTRHLYLTPTCTECVNRLFLYSEGSSGRSGDIVLPHQRLSSEQHIVVLEQSVLCTVFELVETLVIGLALFVISMGFTHHFSKRTMC